MLASIVIAMLGGASVTVAPAPLPTLPCQNSLSIRGAGASSLSATDLVQLLDIGSIPDLDNDPLFTFSPDGRTLVVPVHRAMPAQNSYCSGLYFITDGQSPRLVDSGPGLLFWSFPDLLGKADFPTGFPRVVALEWSPDGRYLAYLKAIDGKAQVWRVDADGSDPRALTSIPGGIASFRFVGSSIELKIEKQEDAARAIMTEGLHGFHYDDRFSPIASNRPFPPGPLALQTLMLDPDTLAVTLLPPAGPIRAEEPSEAWQPTSEPAEGDEDRLGATAPGHGERLCFHPLCLGVVGKPWIGHDPAVIYYLRYEGRAKNETALYSWTIGPNAPRFLYRTPDLLIGCNSVGHDVVCAREGSTKPRFISRIDPVTSTSRSLFDPNPSFGRLPVGRVERRFWRNHFGITSFGDLLYPTGYVAGRRYPLIVVQYTSRGFLRGGTGDEFPVQLFADHGYFVLNIQRPAAPGLAGRRLTLQERQHFEMADFRERRNILSTIIVEVRSLIASGMVDERRIGISGLSDGATTVQYALVHSHLFAAASAVGCCFEPSESWTLGPALARSYRTLGWPLSNEPHASFWNQISLARNASSIHTPLLIDAADDEYLGSLESVTALQEAKSPVDLYVFPSEHHVKWQPAHRLAIYQRNLDWFDFWLMGRLPANADDHDDEARRWTALRTGARSRHASISRL